MISNISEPLRNSRHTLHPVAAILFFIILCSLVVFRASDVRALSGSQFISGNIIDDGVFYDTTTMNQTDIQNFLNSKVPSCDTYGDRTYFGSNTAYNGTVNRRTYARLTNNPGPDTPGKVTAYTCLRDYPWQTEAIAAETNLCNQVSGGKKSSAQVIYDIAKACGINPQTFIVLLQKEQSLVTDEWPWPIQFEKATGFGCPDTAPCNQAQAGFVKQVYSAGRGFKNYILNNVSFNYHPYMNNFISYQANDPSCGGTNVYIQNNATASLYIYTPYQPNQAALNNLLGTGDGCSAYGNRNFWRMFNEWFMSTTAVAYQARNYNQTVGTVDLYPGQTINATFRYLNTGGISWYDDQSVPTGQYPTHLAIRGASHGKFSATWPQINRPGLVFSRVLEGNGSTITVNQHVVAPGQIAEFTFQITAPKDMPLGSYTEFIQPVRENAPNWDPGVLASYTVNVRNPYAATVISSPKTTTVNVNNRTSIVQRYKNNGVATWYDSASKPIGGYATQLITANQTGRQSGFSASWLSPSRPAADFSKVYEADGTTLSANQHTATSGQIVEYVVPLTPPKGVYGQYDEYLQLVIDGNVNWFTNTITKTVVDIGGNNGASYYSQSAYPAVGPGEIKTVHISYRNSGTSIWYDDDSALPGIAGIHLATAEPVNRVSTVAHNWINNARPRYTFSTVYESDGATLSANQHIVHPGQIAKFEFPVRNNNIGAGSYSREHFTPVIDNYPNWGLTSQKVWLDVVGL